MDNRRPYSMFGASTSFSSRGSHQNPQLLNSGHVSSNNGYLRRNPQQNNYKYNNRDDRKHWGQHGQLQNTQNYSRVRSNSNSSTTATALTPMNNSGCKNYICPGCNYPYNYYIKNRAVLTGKVPRILPCEHTLCEECINKSIKTTNQVCCRSCSHITRNNNELSFDYNHYIIGQIQCSKLNQTSPIDYSSIELVSTGGTHGIYSRNSSLVSDLDKKCGLGDCENLGTTSCVDCCKIYCSACDEALHNSENHLINHKRNSVEKISFELSKCPKHLMLEDLHCNNCEENCCCYCMLENHESHNRKYLSSLDKEEEAELKTAYTKANKKIIELQKVQKREKKPEVDKVSEIELEIAHTFTDIHVKLYLIEKNLTEQAKGFHPNFKKYNQIVNANIETLRYLVKCVDCREDKKINLKSLLQKLKEIVKIPSFSLEDRGEAGVPRLLVDDRIQDLEDFFSLEISDSESNLAIKSELSEDLNDTVSSDENSYSSRQLKFALNERQQISTSGSKSNVTDEPSQLRLEPIKKQKEITHKSESDDTPLQKKHLELISKRHQKYALENKPKEKHTTNEGTNKPEMEVVQQNVIITHIHSLDCFYVRFKREENRFSLLEREIFNHVQRTEGSVEDVEVAKLYLAPCLTDKNKWGRVRVIEELTENEDDIKYKVNYIDFGNTAVVYANEIKYISASLAKKKPSAVHCRLSNPSKVEWAKDAHLQLSKFLNVNGEVVMITRSKSNDIYTVDLNIITSCGNLYSVTDLLILGIDALEKNASVSQGSNQLFENSDHFAKGESYEIFLRYVLDPWNIYVQKASYENSLNTLMHAMENYYKNSHCDLHVPIKDTHVVIYYPSRDYGSWHRARIQEVFNIKQIVNVFLVDWGKRVNVSWMHLRRLVESFKKAECLVVRAKLADVSPASNAGWALQESLGALEYLEKYSVKSKILKMLISENDPLEIILFEDRVKYDENINALLVKHNLAISTGRLSETIEWFHQEKLPENPDENEFLPIYENSSEDAEYDDETDCVKSRIKVVRFNDPHSIQVSFESTKEEADRLHEELQIHYQEEYDIQDSWEVNDKVVVFDNKEKSYYRGKILAITGEEYNVQLLDKVDTITVREEDLRRISPYFANNFPNMVLKCHLANIKPAGGNKWSNLSIEWFQKMLNKSRDLFIKKVFDDKSKSSIPVTMWYSKVIQGTALEPASCKFISVDKKMIKAGLALKVASDNTVLKKPTPNNDLDESADKRSTEKDGSEQQTASSDVEPQDRSRDFVEAQRSDLGEGEGSDLNVSIEKPLSNSEIISWLPPLPIEKTEFYAYVTCAETEGYLFVREKEHQALYEELQTNMKEHFDSIPKAKPFRLYRDQMVTIWFENLWYRGIVLSVIDDETAKVMMIDFGSDHEVKLDHLHYKIMYPEVPILVTKIKLYNVYSHSSKWTDSDVDILLENVSDYSRIVIRSGLKIEIPLADVYDANGACLNDKLVELSQNLYRISSNTIQTENSDNPYLNDKILSVAASATPSPKPVKAWSSLVEEADDKCSDVLADFPHVNLPNSFPGQKIRADIVSVYDYRTVSIYIMDDESKEEDFVALSEAMQEEAGSLEPLEDLKINMPCIAIFQEDNLWYRAKIFRLDALACGYATVFFVDYGNFEIVKISDIKPIKSEWMDFKVKFSVAKLNYTIKDKNQHKYLLKHMESLTGVSKLVEFVQKKPLSIHVYEEDGETLFYDAFVKNDIVKID